MHTKHCIKRKLLLPSSLSFGNNSLFLHSWDFPTPLTIFQLTYFCHPLPPDLFPSCCHFLSLWHANGAWIIAKSLSTASPERSLSLYPDTGQQHRWSEGLQCVCRYKVPLPPIHIACTPTLPVAVCTVQNTTKAQLGWNEYLVWAASFCAWVPEPQVCPVLITVTPLPRCLPQLRWEWTIDIESISNYKHCSCRTPSPRLAS